MTARQVPPIIANTDFQQWNSWEPVTTPGGDKNYFVVPGYGGQYVFDPSESDATGNIMIYRNPQAIYDRAEEERAYADKANSWEAQAAPVAGQVIGAVGAYYAGSYLAGTAAASAAAASAAAASAAAAAAATGTVAATGTAAAAATGTAAAAGGAGAAGSMASMAAAALPVAAVLVAAYLVYQYKDEIGQAFGVTSKNRWDEERKRLVALEEAGVLLPEGWKDNTTPKGGRSKSELVAIEEERAANGEWSNVAFAQSRDVADLRGKDIWGYSVFFETDPGWLTEYTENQREAVANQMLAEGLVTEGRGQINFTDNNRAGQIFDEIKSRPPEEFDKPEPPVESNADREAREAQETLDLQSDQLAAMMDNRVELGAQPQPNFLR